MTTRINKARKNNAPAPRPRNRAVLFATGAGILGVVTIAIWAGGKALIPESAPPAEEQAAEPQPATTDISKVSESPGEEKLFSDTMLAAEEDEPEQPVETEQEEETNLPFKLEQVAGALSQIELDENGDIVLNETAQTVLEQAFLDARVTMDEQQLAELKAMIEAGLGGQAGEQAVEITEKFYRYSNAFREISDTLAVRSDPQSLRNDYEQIARLRRTHLGPELADQLYHREEQMARYTLEVMAIQADPDLTPEQRTERQQKLASRYPEVMPNGGSPDDDSSEQATN
ncbi:lipase secretion chaperone [Marinobacter sp. M1N3S26]|uniref:lipase secretion chaperone n=1 Tax=Marinobacter sp. M1N3S26 TaxID=3382299 RepID=UPI00387B773D